MERVSTSRLWPEIAVASLTGRELRTWRYLGVDTMGPILTVILLLLVAGADASPMKILQYFGEVGGTVAITLNVSCNFVSDLEKEVGGAFDLIGHYVGSVFQEIGNFTDRLSLVLETCSFLITNLTKQDGGLYKYTRFMSNAHKRNEIQIYLNVTDPAVSLLTEDSSAGHHGNMAGLLAACFSWFPTFQSAAHFAMFLLFLGTAEIPHVISQAMSDAKCWERFNFAAGWMMYITLLCDFTSMTLWFIDGNPHGLAWVLLVTSILKMAVFLYGVLRPCVKTGCKPLPPDPEACVIRPSVSYDKSIAQDLAEIMPIAPQHDGDLPQLTKDTGLLNLCRPPSPGHPIRGVIGQIAACQRILRVACFMKQIIEHAGFSVCVLIMYFVTSYDGLTENEKHGLIISAVVSIILQIATSLLLCCLCYKPSSEDQCDKTQTGADPKNCKASTDGAYYEACPPPMNDMHQLSD